MSNYSSFGKDYFEGEGTHFNKIGGYEKIASSNFWRFKKLKNLIKEYVEDHKSLLDVGCAYGHFLAVLKDDFKVSGIDISSHAIKVAKHRLRVPLRVGNVQQSIPFKKKFDIVTAIDVIEHLTKPLKGFKCIHKSLNKNGLFFFEVPTVNNWLSGLINRLFFSMDKTHVFVKSINFITRMVEHVGFKRLSVYSTLLPWFSTNKLLCDSLGNVLFVFQKV